MSELSWHIYLPFLNEDMTSIRGTTYYSFLMTDPVPNSIMRAAYALNHRDSNNKLQKYIYDTLGYCFTINWRKVTVTPTSIVDSFIQPKTKYIQYSEDGSKKEIPVYTLDSLFKTTQGYFDANQCKDPKLYSSTTILSSILPPPPVLPESLKSWENSEWGMLAKELANDPSAHISCPWPLDSAFTPTTKELPTRPPPGFGSTGGRRRRKSRKSRRKSKRSKRSKRKYR
jgi:hypothetical protein